MATVALHRGVRHNIERNKMKKVTWFEISDSGNLLIHTDDNFQREVTMIVNLREILDFLLHNPKALEVLKQIPTTGQNLEL